MQIILIIIAVSILCAAASIITAILMRKNHVPKSELDLITFEKQVVEDKLNEERANSSKLLDEEKSVVTQLRADLQLARDKAVGMEYEKNNNAELRSLNESLSAQLQSAQKKVAAFEAERAIFNEQRDAYAKQIKDMQDALKVQFENLGNKIFGEHSKTFKQESQSRLAELLSPLKGDIDGFKKKMEDSFGAQAKEQHSLKSEIERIVKVTEQMTSTTTNLTSALKGDFRSQGNWGEVILERILEESGLRMGEDYILQGAEMGMRHPETGQPLKPDVIVKLPDDKHVIIDSKVSLTDYERFCSEDDDAARAGHLKQFLYSVKKHVNDLEQRRYQDSDKLKAPDFVLMFMPIEGAFSLAVQQDRELHSYSWGKKVVIVCPSILFATLRTIASIWRLELQHKHALEIARQGGMLYDKIAAFVLDMQKLGNQLNSSQTAYNAAMNKLQDGKGNILARTQQLQILGAKASKNLTKIAPEAFDELGDDNLPAASIDQDANEE